MTGIHPEIAVLRAPLTLAARLRALFELTKPNLSGMVVLSGVLGFYLGARGHPGLEWGRLFHLVSGLALTASGAAATNMVLERDLDALMRRTRGRPIPSGRVTPGQASAFAVATFGLGAVELAVFLGPVTALLALVTFGIYALVYTPLKSHGLLALVIGAVPGAIPPVIGHVAAAGEVGAPGLSLFLVLFTWQFPHFLALAWMYEEDYARAGLSFVAEPLGQPAGVRTGIGLVASAAVLVGASVLPATLGVAGWIYGAGAIAAGAGFLAACLRAAIERSHAGARGAFLASITYLPALLGFLVLDRLLG